MGIKYSHRLIPLEAARGIAAAIVVVRHYFLAFAPITRESLVGFWYFAFINGTGAVNFFFVLSGLVLYWGFFRTGDIKKLKIALLKRLPRLAAPVLIELNPVA
jgi:peptidoglycan/LPS O-acetylase OafA/YrhL